MTTRVTDAMLAAHYARRLADVAKELNELTANVYRGLFDGVEPEYLRRLGNASESLRDALARRREHLDA